METARLRWSKIWKDEYEDFYQMEVLASNGRFTATVEDYFTPLEIADFGQQLLNFPQNLNQEVVFENGNDDERSHSYFLLRAYVYDKLGHVALEVKMRTNGMSTIAAYGWFSIATEAASLNKLGADLACWVLSDELNYEHEFY